MADLMQGREAVVKKITRKRKKQLQAIIDLRSHLHAFKLNLPRIRLCTHYAADGRKQPEKALQVLTTVDDGQILMV